MKEVKMLSLDTSSSATGWAYWVGFKLKDNGVIDLKKYKDDKHQEMTLKIWDILNKLNPDVVIIEETSVLTNAQTQRTLTQITGTVYTWCVVNGVEYHSLRPSEWRSKCKSDKNEKLPRKRQELKEWSVAKVKELFDIDTTDDGADAILIGKAYLSLFL